MTEPKTPSEQADAASVAVEKPEQKPCRFHPDARMMPVIEVIDRRTGKRQWCQFCLACDMESKPTGRQEFAS